MQITVLQAILLGIASYAYNSGILGGWIFLNICSRPLTIAFAIGLIMGDMKTAMIIGCVIQALYLGATSIGGVQSMPAIGMSMFFGIPIAMAASSGPEEAAALALTICLACSAIETPLKSFGNIVKQAALHHVDSFVHRNKLKQAIAATYIWQQGLCFLMYGLPVMLLALVGQDAIITMVALLPPWVTGVITTFTSLLRTLGFGLLLAGLLKNKAQWFLFLFGFALVKGMGISVLSLTFIGLGIAYLVFVLSDKGETTKLGV